MAVPTYPSAISLNDIQTEFGGSNPTGFDEYYSGGTNVPAGTANATSVTIPTSGQISMINFSGATKVSFVAQVINKWLLAHGIHSANCASVHHSNGTAQQVASGDITSQNAGSYTWMGSGTAANYDIKATKTGGNGTISFSTGWSNATWNVCSTTRTVYLSKSTTGVVTANVEISIRYNANSTVIATNTHSFYTEADK